MAAVKAMRAVPRAKKATTKDAPSTATDPLGHLRSVADALNKEIAAALQEAEVEVVHKLRTGTRRVEATLETILRERGDRTSADRAMREPAEAWLGKLKKLRKAAGEVRDLDVHREIVAEEFLQSGKDAPAVEERSETATVSASAGNGAGAAQTPDADRILREQAESLDHWLAGRRDKRAATLARKLGKLHGALHSSEEAFLAAARQPAGPQRGKLQRNAGLLALEDFLRLVDRMPVLEAANLHDFRKGAKKARYVAEAGENESAANSAGEEPSPKAIGKAIKQVQDVIGDWHDWLVLRDEAEQALGPAGVPLCEQIAAGVATRFTRAMRTTERMRRRLLGEWLAVRGTSKRRGPRAESAPAPLKRKAAGAVV